VKDGIIMLEVYLSSFFSFLLLVIECAPGILNFGKDLDLDLSDKGNGVHG
jgi:hypothetical protein